VGPFEVVERKGPVAYRLALPDSLRRMHDVFHVFVLRHYVSDPTDVIDMSSLQVSDKGALTMESINILDHRIRQLWCRPVDQVKVQWDNYSPHSATWEETYDMSQHFPYLFDSQTFTSCQMLYLLHFIYCTTSGRSLKQEGVYVTSHSCKNILLTDSLRTLVCK
jgi:hypothetical protein